MGKLVTTILAVGMFAPTLASGADADEREMARDLGAVLSWRLGPEVVEEHCRKLDAAGAEARKKSLTTWQAKNAALIAAVDTRVNEVVPLMRGPATTADPVQTVRAQVKTMLIETIFEGMTAEQSKKVCEAEANPASPRWNSNGIPHVPGSLAALHDWKVSRTSAN